jgi:hypothetical protein
MFSKINIKIYDFFKKKNDNENYIFFFFFLNYLKL